MIYLGNNIVNRFFNPEVKAIMFKSKLSYYFLFKKLQCPPTHTEKVSGLLQASDSHTHPETQHFLEQKPKFLHPPVTLSQPLSFPTSDKLFMPVTELSHLLTATLPSNITKIKVVMLFPTPQHNFTISRPFWRHFKNFFH